MILLLASIAAVVVCTSVVMPALPCCPSAAFPSLLAACWAADSAAVLLLAHWAAGPAALGRVLRVTGNLLPLFLAFRTRQYKTFLGLCEAMPQARGRLIRYACLLY